MSTSKAFLLKSMKALALGWGMIFFYVLFNSFGSLMLKVEVQKLGNWNFSSIQSGVSFFAALFSSWRAWLSLISISIATCAWIVALANLDLSKAYPVAIGFNLLIVVGMALFYFREPLTISKIAGTFFIFSGVLLLFR